ncbi:protein kinase domain-containing protein [Streptomyces paludis]|uniref:non-specific serine/threonine protein kinase n=1 Tax=Streptomyces paludis TaxID=2282738 RepID=A0A345HQJ0_9ACTN|nr:protein kinase [Streptomyces paludis]AXG78964.1 serine/threonine protein kinase [Streptomyces paludis]
MAPEPEAGGGVSDAADSWGDNGLVGGTVGDGRYRMTHRLGRGGMAEVFAAEDVRLGRIVAVKLLRGDLAEDPISKARFTREAQSVAGLNHHAVVAVYDSGEDTLNGQTVPYMVMELVEGRTIRELLISADPPPPEQALIIVSGVLEALAYSHEHGIVHRDIKPANVIITDAGAVKVMDFGIARALHGAQSTMTQTGMVMGTPQYLSPEQALGKAVDHRSDLYATGCLLYELLALRPPFTGETPLSVVYQHVQDIPVPPSEASDVAPPELDGMVMRSLAKEPDDRFQSAEEMRGLVQYSLQMLQQQGGYTGTWNTGPVDSHGAGGTAAMGMGATTAMGYPSHGETAQGAILPPMNPNDGGYDGGHYGNGGGQYGNGQYGNGSGGGNRGKMILFAALALIAIVVGVAFAVNNMSDTGTDNKKTEQSSTPSETKTSESPTPTETEPSDEPTQDSSTGGNQNPGGFNTPRYTPSYPQKSEEPTYTQPTDTDTQPSDDGGNTDEGADSGASAGTTEGTANAGTDNGGSANAGTDAGANAGTDNGGSANAGTDAGTSTGTDAGTGTSAGTGG